MHRGNLPWSVRGPFGLRCLRAGLGIAALWLAVMGSARAVTCTTQSEMTAAERSALANATRSLAAKMQAGDVSAVQADTIPAVAGNFNSIANTIQRISPDLKSATITVNALYDFDASDVQPNSGPVQFFCGVAANDLHVIFNIPGLPAGHFAFVIAEATGVKNPQRLSMILQRNAAGIWQLAGLFPRPLMNDGHDGVWYWARARDYQKEGRPWTAYFYYRTAIDLLLPAEFVDSNNFDKLVQEMREATPGGLPGQQPMMVNVNGAQIPVTDIHTDSTFGGYDLVIRYDAGNVSDLAATRARSIALMKAMLALHPEWRTAFHGMWVFADAPGQSPFSLELPMAQIEAQS